MATEGENSMEHDDFVKVVQKARRNCSTIARIMIYNEGGDTITEEETVNVKVLADALMPLYMEKVLLAEEGQPEAQRLLQKLKQLKGADEIYVIGINKAGASSSFGVIQDHTQKAITVLSLLLRELNVTESSNLRARKSAVTDMDKFIESVEFVFN